MEYLRLVDEIKIPRGKFKQGVEAPLCFHSVLNKSQCS